MLDFHASRVESGDTNKPVHSRWNRVSICCKTWDITTSGLAILHLWYRPMPAGIKHVLRRTVCHWTGTNGKWGLAFEISLLTGIQPELWLFPVLRRPYWICGWTVHHGMSGIAPLSRQCRKTWGRHRYHVPKWLRSRVIGGWQISSPVAVLVTKSAPLSEG